jgi:multidrug resistance efflux pump
VVKTGDLLFQVDPRPYQVALDQAEAQLLQAESQLSQAKAQVSASQAQVEQALAKVAQGEAEVTQTAADQRRTELAIERGEQVKTQAKEIETMTNVEAARDWAAQLYLAALVRDQTRPIDEYIDYFGLDVEGRPKGACARVGEVWR